MSAQRESLLIWLAEFGHDIQESAWSLDRLQVNYHREGEEGFVLISPEHKLSFMRDLVSRGTGLEMRGECVIRAPE